MQVAHMPSAEPMLGMDAGRTQGFAMRSVPTITSWAKQGAQGGGLWKGSNGFPNGLPRKALKRVTDAVQDEIMIKGIYPLPNSACSADVVQLRV